MTIEEFLAWEQGQELRWEGATVFARAGDDWVGHVVGPDTMPSMPEIAIDLPLAELYEGVEFGATEQSSGGL
jgi:hypothetical protein